MANLRFVRTGRVVAATLFAAVSLVTAGAYACVIIGETTELEIDEVTVDGRPVDVSAWRGKHIELFGSKQLTVSDADGGATHRFFEAMP